MVWARRGWRADDELCAERVSLELRGGVFGAAKNGSHPRRRLVDCEDCLDSRLCSSSVSIARQNVAVAWR